MVTCDQTGSNISSITLHNVNCIVICKQTIIFKFSFHLLDCDDIEEKLHGRCQNGGTCIMTSSDEIDCQCTKEYEGKYCEMKKEAEE